MKRLILSLIVILCLAGLTFAQEIIAESMQKDVPEGKEIPKVKNWGVQIKSHVVSVEIKDQVAITTVKQVFFNPNEYNLTGTYVFALPENASINEFKMIIDGKEIKGEIVEKAEAAKIYTDLIRKNKNAGLLEYINKKSFKATVYPLLPNKDTPIEIKYTQLLKSENELVEFEYPMNTARFSDAKIEELKLSVNLKTTVPIRSIYSPSHEIKTQKTDENNAIITFDAKNIVSDKDFELYYAYSNKDFAMNLLTYADGQEDGYFMLMVTPKTKFDETEILPKDIVFVLDISGSMNTDNKIGQAKNALKYCVKNLKTKDKFNIITFNSGIETYKEIMLDANEGNINAAVKFTEELYAMGGTNINDALSRALSTIGVKEEGRIKMIVFLTDGQPTSGVTNVEQIVKNSAANNKNDVRIFTFGVGYDVNTFLLDSIAENSHGTRDYVKPKEDIEEVVSSFFNKISNPVLGSLELKFDGVKAYRFLPRTMPDIFKGTQLTVFGRYAGDGNAKITLTGTVAGKSKTFEVEQNFAKTDTSAEFLPRLWAVRRIGFLVDQQRLYGQNEEFRKEIIQLGKRFGIVTSYTSMIAHDGAPSRDAKPGTSADGWGGDKSSPSSSNGRGYRNNPSGGGAGRTEGKLGGDDEDSQDEPEKESNDSARKKADNTMKPLEKAKLPSQPEQKNEKLDSGGVTGKDATKSSEELRRMREAQSENAEADSKIVGTKKFVKTGEWWIDASYKLDDFIEKPDKIKLLVYLSEEYLTLSQKIADLAKYFTLGEKVIAVHDSLCYIVDNEEGIKKIEEAFKEIRENLAKQKELEEKAKQAAEEQKNEAENKDKTSNSAK